MVRFGDPAQASAATMTCTPASAAASAVESTQQSVVTPASTISPRVSERSVGLGVPLAEGRPVDMVAAMDANSSLSSYSGAFSGSRAKGHCS